MKLKVTNIKSLYFDILCFYIFSAFVASNIYSGKNFRLKFIYKVF